jgi:hypothetical protein
MVAFDHCSTHRLPTAAPENRTAGGKNVDLGYSPAVIANCSRLTG